VNFGGAWILTTSMVPSRERLEFESGVTRVVSTNRTGVVAPMEIASATSPAGFVVFLFMA
jgi:hypothetical protein